MIDRYGIETVKEEKIVLFSIKTRNVDKSAYLKVVLSVSLDYALPNQECKLAGTIQRKYRYTIVEKTRGKDT